MSRSLDSPVQIELRKPVNNNNINKEKRYGKRNRAGTIRASDFMQPNIANDLGKQDAPPLGGNGSIVTRRTRSGTVIGPSQSFTRTRSGTIIGPSRPAPSRPTVAPRNQQHAHTRPSGDLDLEAHAGKLPVLNSEDESEDELLLKGHWHDEDWVVAPALAPVCGRAKGKGKMRIWNKESVPPMEQDDGDKELLLVASKKGE
jgi:hypothetical protein